MEMKKMEDQPRQRNRGHARTQKYQDERKSELQLPQPQGCRKTTIIRRETECVQTAVLAGSAVIRPGGFIAQI
jgi:hypothetical protein